MSHLFGPVSVTFVGADVRPWKEQPPQPSLTGKVFS
jgi:hypothetical protein